jgi:2-polyprenyl-6-hydroxyphenyl methylase/3-demethylubiquinone-9 3-methyltransferase
MLGDLNGKRLLDVGCGLGAGSWLLATRGAHVTGIDISEDAIAWASRTYLPEAGSVGARLEFWAVDLLASDGGGLGVFDALTVVDVLEHFPREEGRDLLARLAGLLAPGGLMFLHVPVTANSLDWLLVVKNGLLGKRLQGRVLDHHGDETHATRFSVGSLSRLLREADWTTRALELRAYRPRLRPLERDVLAGRWTASDAAMEQSVTDWDGVHSPVSAL